MKIKFSKILSGVLYFYISITGLNSLNAQISVTSGAFTPVNLVKNVFLGEGVEVTSVTFNGTANAVGYFGNGTNDIGIEKGIVMSTGNANSAGTPNNSSGTTGATSGSSLSDPDLASLTGGAPLYDIAQYIIKFIPTNDTLRFKYVFGSEEYPEYTCSTFNDVFGFFISGPGISGPFANGAINIALVPDPADPTGLTFTNVPVTITNVQNGNPVNPSCIPSYPQYYNSKIGSTTITYDAVLDVFIAQVVVTPCQEYTIKLSIADRGDPAFDSVVFLEAKSFGTGSVRVTTTTTSLDGAVAEGCVGGIIKLKLPGAAESDYFPDYKIFGTATNGVDYEFIAPGQFIPKGDSELVFIVNPFIDGLPESVESIGLDIQRDVCHRDTFYVYIKDNQLVPPTLPVSSQICEGDSLTLDGTLPINLPKEQVFENNIQLVIPDPDTLGGTGTPVYSDILVTGVQPATLGPGMISKVCINIMHSWDDDLDVYLISPGGQFMELTTDNGRDGNDYTNTCFTPTATQPINYNNPFGAPKIYTPFTGSFIPEGDWNYLYSGGANPANGIWRLVLVDDYFSFQGKLLNWSIAFNPIYSLKYDWNPNNKIDCINCPVAQFNPDSTQTYTLKVSDTYGCIVLDTTKINVDKKVPAPNVLCGTTTANTIDFTWTPDPNSTGYLISTNGTNWVLPVPGPNNHTLYGLTLGMDYTLYVQSLGLCGGHIDTVTCKTPDCVPPLVSIAAQTNVTCPGGSDGAIDLNAVGQYPPYTFNVTANMNTTGDFSGLIAGTYSANISDAQGCAVSFQFQITEPLKIVSQDIVIDSISCNGYNDGKATFSVTGGTGPYTFLWNTGSTDSIALNLKSGLNTVTITDSKSCKQYANVTIGEPKPVSLSITPLNPTCFNGMNGVATVNPSGGSGGFQYQWDASTGNQTSKSAINLPAGNYFVTVTDAKGCTSAKSVALISPSNITTSISSTNLKCFGDSNGSATVTVNGGTLPYFYIWSDPNNQTTDKAINLTTGKFYVTVTDSGTCTAIDSVVISSPQQLIANSQTVPTSCFNTKDGKITISSFGGTPGYSYNWNDIGNGPAIRTDAGAGTYSVTVTDANGCTNVLNGIIVTSPTNATISTTTTNVKCFGGADGTATATAIGGNGGWNYLWNDALNQDLQTASFLIAGTYMVTATDMAGCSIADTVLITEPLEIQVNPAINNVSCFGGNNGSINLNPTGGTGALSFNWLPSNSGPNILNLIAGIYNVTVTDINSCIKTFDYTLTQPKKIDINIQVGNVSCSGVFDGEATAIVNGGIPGYTFKWSDPAMQTTAKATGLAPGVYYISVTDQNSCVAIDTFDISSPTSIVVQLSNFDVSCFGGSDGAIGATTFGGTTPYKFLWSNGDSINVANHLKAGIYILTVTDAKGCTVVNQTEVKEPSEIIINPTITGLTCPRDKNGSISIVVTGGFSPYTASWSNGDTTNIASNLGQGTYTLFLKDAKGCVKTGSYTIPSLDTLDISFTVVNVSCFGSADGAVNAEPIGGTPGYSYLWSNQQTTKSIDKLLPGNYNLTITDSKGCMYDKLITVSEPDSVLVATAVGQDVDCNGEENGAVIFKAQGGTPPYYYSVDSINYIPNSIEIGLAAGSYNTYVKDKNGCKVNSGVAIINEPLPFSVSLGPDFKIKLRQDTQLLAQVVNGVGLINYKWIVYDTSILSCQNCPNPKIDTLFNPVLFKVIVTDEHGCTASDDINILIDKTRKVYVPTAFTPNGDLINDVLLTHGEKDAFVRSFQIFDAWGEMVFQSLNFNLGDENVFWDGKLNGQLMNVGTFVWYMDIQYIDGVSELLKGSFDLLR